MEGEDDARARWCTEGKGSRDVVDRIKGIKAGEGRKHGRQGLGDSQAAWLLFSIRY